MGCQNCNENMSLSTKNPGGRFAILSLASTVVVLLVLIVQCVLISLEAPYLLVRILRILNALLAIAGIVTGVLALARKNLLGIAGIVLALLGYSLLPRMVLSVYFRIFHR